MSEVGSLERQYPLAIPHGGRAGVPAETPLPWTAESDDVRSCKGPAASLTLCMGKLQSQEGRQLCHVVTTNCFLPKQLSYRQPGQCCRPLCWLWRPWWLLVCCFWLCYPDTFCVGKNWAEAPRQLLLFPIYWPLWGRPAAGKTRGSQCQQQAQRH